MAMDKIGDGLKKFLLVGIGAAAVTVEKSQQIIDELVKKGEITVEQGKELNKELQGNLKKTMEARRAGAENIEEKIARMGADELAVLKKKIHEAEEALEDLAEGDEEIRKEKEEEEDLDEYLKEEGAAGQTVDSEETPADN